MKRVRLKVSGLLRVLFMFIKNSVPNWGHVNLSGNIYIFNPYWMKVKKKKFHLLFRQCYICIILVAASSTSSYMQQLYGNRNMCYFSDVVEKAQSSVAITAI